MKITTAFVCAAAGLAAAALAGSFSRAPAADMAVPAGKPCPPSGGLNYICGIPRGEDLVVIPATRWVIASGLGEGAALHLIDAVAKTGRRWYPTTYGAKDVMPPRADLKAYPGCPSPPNAQRFFAHGLSLRPKGPGRYTLYMVNHAGREAIEVFEVDAAPADPTIRWTGCVPMPKDQPANSVAAAPDGSARHGAEPARYEPRRHPRRQADRSGDRMEHGQEGVEPRAQHQPVGEQRHRDLARRQDLLRRGPGFAASAGL
jgi:hypothetical protein